MCYTAGEAHMLHTYSRFFLSVSCILRFTPPGCRNGGQRLCVPAGSHAAPLSGTHMVAASTYAVGIVVLRLLTLVAALGMSLKYVQSVCSTAASTSAQQPQHSGAYLADVSQATERHTDVVF